MRLALAMAILCFASHAQTVPPALLKDARIALRLGTNQVLIVGGVLTSLESKRGVYQGSMESLPHASGHSPLQPVEEILRVPSGYLSRFRIDPPTKWRVGDRWRIYTGAGSPVAVVIQSLSFGYYCGGIGGYATALARIENPHSVDAIAGLRAGEYLAAPSAGLPGVSEVPLVPVDALYEGDSLERIESALLARGRKIVTGDSWHTEQLQAERLDEVRQMNRSFLNGEDLRFESHFLRWRVMGRKPLLFVESIWNDANGKPVFGGDGVIEEGAIQKGGVPVILGFEPKEGELMRAPEILGSGGWTRPAAGVFLNAWVVGTRRFVLIHTRGYEGFSVELMEIVPGKGLVPTGIGFGSGC